PALHPSPDRRHLHSFPTRRSSDLAGKVVPRHHLNWGTDDDSDGGTRLVELSYDEAGDIVDTRVQPEQDWEDRHPLPADAGKGTLDRKSTRLNSSHVKISYAVFCLK